MKCKSCAGEVPPKFAHAILVNICPLCGDAIMDDELQLALKDLKSAMNAVSSYPQEILDWLKSNYNLYSEVEVEAKVKEIEVKTTETVKALYARPTEARHNNQPINSVEDNRQVELDNDGNQVAGPSLQSSEQTNKFFKNAQANKVLNQQQHFKNIVKQIKKSGSPALLDESGTSGIITPDMAESIGDVDPVELAELRAALGDEDSDIQSGLDSSDVSYEDEIPSIVLNMARKAGGNGRDLAQLQKLQGKSARAKSEMAKTGSVGLIRR